MLFPDFPHFKISMIQKDNIKVIKVISGNNLNVTILLPETSEDVI